MQEPNFNFLLKLFEAYLLDSAVRREVDRYIGNGSAVPQQTPSLTSQNLEMGFTFDALPDASEETSETGDDDFLSGLIG